MKKTCEGCKLEFELLVTVPDYFKFYCNNCQFSMEMDIQIANEGDNPNPTNKGVERED